MSTPSIVLRVDSTPNGTPFGSFGDQYDDVTQPGVAGRVLQYRTTVGDPVTIQARIYCHTYTDANARIASLADAQGNEIFLYDNQREQQWRGFLHRASPQMPQRIGGHPDGYDYVVMVDLQWERTQ